MSCRLSNRLACVTCGDVYDSISPRHFSWNHAEGACTECGGLGETLQFQPELLVPDPLKIGEAGRDQAVASRLEADDH